MIQIPMDVYMESLTGFIKDEDKLVTYKWLSKELKVHVNISKQILSEYWEKHKNDGISATFMLIGNVKDGGIRVEVVRDSDLSKSIEKYDKLVSQHLYSLQKVLPAIESLAGLAKVDAEFGAIRCKESVILSDEELFKRRWGSNVEYQEKYSEPNKEKKQEEETVNTQPKDEKKSQENNDNKEEKEKSEAKSEVKKSSPPTFSNLGNKKGIPKKPVQSTTAGFGNLFGKASSQKKSPPANLSKSSSNKSDKESQEKPEPPSFFKNALNPKKSPPNESTIFSGNTSNKKAPVKNGEKPSSPKETAMEIEVSSPETLVSTPTSSNEDEKDTIRNGSQNSKGKNSSKDLKVTKNGKGGSKVSKTSDSDRGKKRGRSQESRTESKKRKRIIVHDSSDDSGSSEKEEEPDTSEDSLCNEEPPKSRERSPSPPVVQQIGGKRKVRKTVDQTFVGEDGFMVTKKVQVMESASEDDEPVVRPNTETKKKVEKTKSTASVKGKKMNNKQTTLTSFFKKA